MRINWKIRFKNPYFWISLVGIILTAMGANVETLTTWGAVAEQLKALIGNPFLIGSVFVAVLGAMYDPTTAGLGDSERALAYTAPSNATMTRSKVAHEEDPR